LLQLLFIFTYANGLQMSAIWGARTLALDIVVAVVGTAMTEEEKRNKK